MIRAFATLTGAVYVAGVIYSQSAAGPQFEVASVRPSRADATNGGSSVNTRDGRLTMTNVTLRQCIVAAFRVKEYQLSGGPGWLNSDRYDIVAKADQPVKDLMPMLQTLLAERFQLAIHREGRMFQAYVLEVAKNGPKLEKAGPEGGSNTSSGRGTITAQRTTMDRFSDTLSRTMERPVVDRTGLEGAFNLKLEWTPDTAQPSKTSGDGKPAESVLGPSIFTAIQQQLGLKLEGPKAPIEILIIDRAEKATEN